MAAATAWYREGTVSVTSGSKAIVGVGTSWLSQVLPGDLFYLADANGNLTSVPTEVDTVSSDTAIALKAIWPGSTVSGVKYGIVRHFNNTLPADLSARLSKLIANYQITVDQLITLLTSSGQVTITGLDGNNYTVLGLLGYANQVPDHNANDSAHGMTAPGRTLLRAASYAEQRVALSLANHNLISVDGVGNIVSSGVFAKLGTSATAAFDHGYALTVGVPATPHRLDFRVNNSTSDAYNTNVVLGDASVLLPNDGGGKGIVIGKHDGAAWRFDTGRITSKQRVVINAMPSSDDGISGLQVGGSGKFTDMVLVATGNPSTDHGFSFQIGFGDERRIMAFACMQSGGAYNAMTSAGDQAWLAARDSGGFVVGKHDGAGMRFTSNSIVMSHSLYTGGGVHPGNDNGSSVGSAGMRYSTAYFATNPVIGSDARLKTDVEEIPGAIAAEIMQSLRPVTFRYKVGGQEPYEEDEPFEEQVQVTEPGEVLKTTVQIVDGKAVQVTTTETVQQPVYDEFPLVDGDGKPVMQLVTPAVLDEESGEEVTPAVYVQAVHREPRMTAVTKTRKVTKYREVEGKRYHAGYIAQEVKAALDAVADRWPPAADLAVWLLSDTADADSTQMVRMEQMTPILHAAMRHLHA